MQKRVFIIGFLILIMAGVFWTQSRYPALNDKASGDIITEDSLSFDALLSIKGSAPVYQKILFSTINWIYTNKEGMIFGVLLATAFLTLIGYLHRHGGKNPFINAFKGTLIGAPLGVCVNCAAPIAKGMYKAGSSMGTSLATMFSSPTLNIVVLTMLFSLFPLYMTITKLVLTFLLILTILPILSKYVFKSEGIKHNSKIYCPRCRHPESTKDTWGRALKRTGKDLLKNFIYIVKTVVPLMLLAGLLGVLFITFLPLENFIDFKVNIITLFIAAFIGTFLPIPMAFDIIVVHALMQAGLRPAFAMILLFTLGIYSIYPLFIISKTISKRVSASLFIIIMILGVLGGYSVQAYDDYKTEKILRIFDSNIGLGINTETQAKSGNNDQKTFQHTIEPRTLMAEHYYTEKDISIESISHQKRGTSGTKPFSRYEGDAFGLDKHLDFSASDFIPPLARTSSIASGDYNNDHWPDILLGNRKGILLYKNLGTNKFALQKIDIPEINDLSVIVVAFVDIDNDGWQDIYLTSFGEGKNYFILNDRAGFKNSKIITVPNEGALVTKATSFADLDKNGDLDFVHGNWFHDFTSPLPSKNGIETNKLIRNKDLQFKEESLEEFLGQTLSVSLSDFNNDNNPDLIIANDFAEPDIFYVGNALGELKEIKKADNIIPISAFGTMSIDVADFNNDLIMDMYFGNVIIIKNL